MNTAQTVEFLQKRVGLFQFFSSERLGEVVAGSRLVSFQPKEAIACAGDEVHFLGVMLEGTAAISAVSASGERHAIGTFKAGDTFGEMAVMTGDKAAADLFAETPCQALLIPLTLFRSIIMAEPRAVQQISQTITKR